MPLKKTLVFLSFSLVSQACIKQENPKRDSQNQSEDLAERLRKECGGGLRLSCLPPEEETSKNEGGEDPETDAPEADPSEMVGGMAPPLLPEGAWLRTSENGSCTTGEAIEGILVKGKKFHQVAVYCSNEVPSFIKVVISNPVGIPIEDLEKAFPKYSGMPQLSYINQVGSDVQIYTLGRVTNFKAFPIANFKYDENIGSQISLNGRVSNGSYVDSTQIEACSKSEIPEVVVLSYRWVRDSPENSLIGTAKVSCPLPKLTTEVLEKIKLTATYKKLSAYQNDVLMKNLKSYDWTLPQFIGFGSEFISRPAFDANYPNLKNYMWKRWDSTPF